MKSLTMSKISLVKARFDSQIQLAISEAIDWIEFKFAPDINKIAIKPNMCYYWHPSIGDTTSPRFVAHLIDVLREKVRTDPEISIVESDASSMKCEHVFKFLGYGEMAREKNVRLINLSREQSEKREVSVEGRTYRFKIPYVIKNADLFVNVPKIKYMPVTKISCALKNIFGCNPYRKKFRYHPHLDHVIISLNKILPSDLCVVDGIVVRGTSSLKLGLIMASTDPVAVDSAAARMLGLRPEKITHIVLAEKENVGKRKFSTVGDSLENFIRTFPVRDSKERVFGTLTTIGSSVARKLRSTSAYTK